MQKEVDIRLCQVMISLFSISLATNTIIITTTSIIREIEREREFVDQIQGKIYAIHIQRETTADRVFVGGKRVKEKERTRGSEDLLSSKYQSKQASNKQ